MKEYKYVENAEAGSLPAVVGMWNKVKRFLVKPIDMEKPVVLELTVKEEKVLTEVHDFLFQEIEFPELRNFFLHDINIFEKIRNWREKKKNNS